MLGLPFPGLAWNGVEGGYDPSFASGGRRLVGVSGGVDELVGMALRPNRKIVLAGACTGVDGAGSPVSVPCVAELSASGASTGFGVPAQPLGPGRWLLTDVQALAPGEEWLHQAFALDATGRLLLAGQRIASENAAMLLRLAPDGRSLDGMFLRNNGAAESGATYFAVAQDANQRILLAGYLVRNGVRFSGMVTRLLPNLQPDTSFGSGGTVLLDEPNYNFLPQRLAVDSQGRIIVLSILDSVVLGVTDAFQVNRLLTNGSIDGVFNGSGFLRESDLPGVVPTALAVDSQDRVLVAGSYVQPVENDLDVFVARLTAAGLYDNGIVPTPGFGAGIRGYEVENLVAVGPNERAADIALQPDGKIVVIGRCQRLGVERLQFLSMRLLDNADLDTSYGAGGVSVGSFEDAPAPGFDDIGVSLALDPIGALVIAGTGISGAPFAAEDFGVARLFSTAAAGDVLFVDNFD